MALVINTRVQETTTNTGTGTITLLGAVSQFQSFSLGIGDGNTTYYMIADQSGNNWEEGIGTYTASSNTLSRSASNVIASSNSNAIVSFTTGTKNVFCTFSPASAVVAAPYSYPVVNPSLSLDFVNSKQLDPRITFTRASTATYYDGKTTALAEQNLFVYSNAFSNTAWVANNVIVASGVADPFSGTNAYSITANTAGASLYQTLVSWSAPVSSYLAAYTISFWAQAVSGSNTANLTLGTAATSNTIVLSSSWTRYSYTANVAQTTTANIGIQLINTSDVINIYGAQLEQRSTNTAYTATTSSAINNYIPVLVTAPANVPRFDYNPATGQPLGLLIEESRTNLLNNSSTFAGWTINSGFTYSANAIIAPDGTQTGGVYVSGIGLYKPGINNNNGSYYTFSQYIKPINPAVSIRLYTDSIGSIGAGYIVPSTGVVSSVSSSSTSLTSTNVGNGWYRLSITGIAGANIALISISNSSVTGVPAVCSLTGYAALTTQISFTTTGTLPAPLVVGTTYYVANATSGYFNISTTADGANLVSTTTTGSGTHSVSFLNNVGSCSAYIFGNSNLYGFWGPQFEAGSFATSYIPTGSSTVTRSQDNAIITGNNFSSWFNQNQGTFYVDMDSTGTTNAKYLGLYCYGADTSSLYSLVNRDVNAFRVLTSGFISQANIVTTSLKSPVKMAASYQKDNFQAAFNGTLGTADTQGFLPTPVNMYIGWNQITGQGAAGHIRKVSYYPIVLTPANLQALTN